MSGVQSLSSGASTWIFGWSSNSRRVAREHRAAATARGLAPVVSEREFTCTPCLTRATTPATSLFAAAVWIVRVSGSVLRMAMTPSQPCLALGPSLPWVCVNPEPNEVWAAPSFIGEAPTWLLSAQPLTPPPDLGLTDSTRAASMESSVSTSSPVPSSFSSSTKTCPLPQPVSLAAVSGWAPATSSAPDGPEAVVGPSAGRLGLTGDVVSCLRSCLLCRYTAQRRALKPRESTAYRSAPCASSMRTIFSLPAPAAYMRAVSPSWF
mmetsp:Transcript_22913/g.66677  ORF Transcript_22913/g.66677 Transcript_22913/m.66677 type:complete len:265 (-) Transcript_22913:906-1700(-)